jgi:hypothetical protein
MEENKEQKSPLHNIEEILKLLEDMYLSPLPNTKKLKNQQKTEIGQIIKKLIFFFDIILLNNLKIGSIGTKGGEDMHYWTFISKYFQIPSVKFINNIYYRADTNPDKGYTWLCISIIEKSIHETLKEIYNQQFDIKFYQYDSMMIEKKHEILNLSQRLSAVPFYEIDIDIVREYNEYKNMKEIEDKRTEEEMPILHSIDSKKNVDKTPFITPFHFNFNSRRDTNMTLLLSRGYEGISNFQSKGKCLLI